MSAHRRSGKKGRPIAPSRPRPTVTDLVPVTQGEGNTFTLKVSDLAPPNRTYDADFAWVLPRFGAISLFFGKQNLDEPTRLRSRVELKLSPDAFLIFWRNTGGDFYEELKNQLKRWPSDGDREDIVPSKLPLQGDKDHSDWASLAYIARTGGYASLDFYFIPGREVLRVQQESNRQKLQAEPVMRVNVGINELGRLLDACALLAPEVQKTLPEPERTDV